MFWGRVRKSDLPFVLLPLNGGVPLPANAEHWSFLGLASLLEQLRADTESQAPFCPSRPGRSTLCGCSPGIARGSGSNSTYQQIMLSSWVWMTAMESWTGRGNADSLTVKSNVPADARSHSATPRSVTASAHATTARSSASSARSVLKVGKPGHSWLAASRRQLTNRQHHHTSVDGPASYPWPQSRRATGRTLTGR